MYVEAARWLEGKNLSTNLATTSVQIPTHTHKVIVRALHGMQANVSTLCEATCFYMQTLAVIFFFWS